MKTNLRFQNKDIDSNLLQLDGKNIRFFHIKNHSSEESLLIVERNSIQKLVNKMVEDGFDPIYPLHINRENVVKDGNRRLLSYRMAIGFTQYEHIAKKYKILNFGRLKKIEKIPVKQYMYDDDLNRYVRSSHLVNEQKEWSSSTKYTYLYNLFINNLPFDYPNDIWSTSTAVELYLNAINFAEEKDKSDFELAYQDKVSVLYRMFGNIKFVYNQKDQSLAKFMKFDFDEVGNKKNFKYNKLINENIFKIILLEIAKYVVKNSVGATKKDITEFPETFEILKNLFQIESTKSAETQIDQFAIITKKNSIANKNAIENMSSNFYLANNVFISFKELKIPSKNKRIQGWKERVLIENSVWYLSAKALKKIQDEKNFDFLSKQDSMEKLDKKYKQIFQKLNIHQDNSNGTLTLASLVSDFVKCFKQEDRDLKEDKLFSKEEKKFIHWLKTSFFSYSPNLNNASHGRWDVFELDSFSKELQEILNKLIKFWWAEV